MTKVRWILMCVLLFAIAAAPSMPKIDAATAFAYGNGDADIGPAVKKTFDVKVRHGAIEEALGIDSTGDSAAFNDCRYSDNLDTTRVRFAIAEVRGKIGLHRHLYRILSRHGLRVANNDELLSFSDTYREPISYQKPSCGLASTNPIVVNAEKSKNWPPTFLVRPANHGRTDATACRLRYARTTDDDFIFEPFDASTFTCATFERTWHILVTDMSNPTH